MSTLTLRSLISAALRAAQDDHAHAGTARTARRGAAAVLMTSGIVAGGLVSPNPAHAQAPTKAAAAATAELDEVVVTGIRGAIESAIEVKRDNFNIVEAISAEDIGKLPDTSIAESISRLPGLTSQRSDGRASDISIRGTDPGFATTLLNGRQQVSTGDNRNIEYDQYPSELISSVIVYKTPDASLIGQGLAGTIALQTTRPLEYGKQTFALNLRGEKNSDASLGSDSKNNGYRASVSYIDQFIDNTLGVTVGYAHLTSPIVGRELGTYDPWHANGTEHAGVPSGVYVTDGIKSLASSGTNRRDGVIGTIEWRPQSNFTSIFDAYYTNAESDNQRRSLESNLGNYPNTPTYSNLQIVDNSLVGATVAGAVPLARNFSYTTKDEILALGWNNKWTTGDWTFMGDLSYSRATRDEQDYETQAQYTGGVTDTVTYNLPSSSQPTFGAQRAYNDPSLVQVGPTIYGAGYSRFPHVVDELKSIRVEGSLATQGWFSDAIVGINYDDRTKNKRQPETGLSTIGNKYYVLPPNYLYGPADLSFSGTPGSLAWNVPAVLNQYFQPIVPTTNAGYLVGKTWEVLEKVTTGYLKGNLNHQLTPDVVLKGNIGLQIVHTDQSSNSTLFNEATNTPSPITDGKVYNDFLPQANFVFQLPAQQSIRFAVAREIARARMDQLAASYDFGVGNGIPGATVGNPRLDPWRATAFDLSYEKYFSNKAYVSAAVFYKDLSSYIYTTTNSSFDFSALCNELVGKPHAQTCYAPTGPIGSLTSPQNGNGGRLEGVEFSVSLPGEMLTEVLSGFGATATISQTDSAIRIPGTVSGIASTSIPLPGLSKTVWSVTAYYEKYGFSARVATRYRSNYIGEINDYAGDRALEYVRHEQITDFQTGYEFQSGTLKGLSVLFQINNLTNTPFIDYAGTENRVRDYETFGRDMFFGFNYKH